MQPIRRRRYYSKRMGLIAMPEILIYGPIGMGWGKTAEEIRGELRDAGGADVVVRINSAGGSFSEGPAIYTALTGYDGNVETAVDGVAYSMAAVVLQAGRTRRMASNSVIMVHGSQFSAEGSAEEMRKTADMMDIHTESMVSAFTAKGIAEDIVRGWLTDGEDHYFTAQQALDAGLIDEISSAVDMAAAVKYIPEDIKLPPALAAYRNPEEGKTMPDPKAIKDLSPDDQAVVTAGIDIAAFSADRNKNIRAGELAGKAAEMKRQNAIRAFFERPQFSDNARIGQDNVAVFADLRDKCLADFNVSPEMARDAALDLQDGMPSPILAVETHTQAAGSSFGHMDRAPSRAAARTPYAAPGIDGKEKFIEAMTETLVVKGNLERDREKLRKAQENEFLSMSVYELARHYLGMNGARITGSRREQIIGQAMISAAGISHSTSDFSSVLENVANKALLMGFEEAPETWQEWARTGTLPDFKQGSRVNMSTFGDLDIVYENGEYKYGSFTDLKEVLTLVTYGKLFSISRQALANDDLSALSGIPRSMGRAAARKVGDLAYNVLINNAAMNQDSTTLFHANHSNIGTGGVPAIAAGGTLDEASKLMGLQTDPTGNVLNIEPAIFLVPRALRVSAQNLMDLNPVETSNAFHSAFKVVSDARLDSNSATAWYLAADPNRHDTVEVAFLNGQETPYLEAKDGWSVDGVEYKVRIDAVAAALDFRGLVYNAGA